MTQAISIEQLIPQSLDSIITKHRDKVDLRLATASEIAAFPLLINTIDSRPVKHGEISDWRVIRYGKADSTPISYFVVGYRNNNVFSTSAVVSIEYKNGNGFLLTENSLYKLTEQSEKEPDMHLLLHICHCFHTWGMGGALGILEVFY